MRDLFNIALLFLGDPFWATPLIYAGSWRAVFGAVRPSINIALEGLMLAGAHLPLRSRPTSSTTLT